MSILSVLGAVAGVVYLCFLPGFSLSYFFFKENKIELVSRVVISIVLSIAATPTTSYIFYLVGVKITTPNLIWEVAILIAAYPAYLLIKKTLKRHKT